jgi:hypothetical protein
MRDHKFAGEMLVVNGEIEDNIVIGSYRTISDDVEPEDIWSFLSVQKEVKGVMGTLHIYFEGQVILDTDIFTEVTDYRVQKLSE